MAKYLSTEKWGKKEAASRYGSPKESMGPCYGPQENQCPEDKHGPKYDNDVPVSRRTKPNK